MSIPYNLPPLGAGYREDLITCIVEQQRDKWRKQWECADDLECKREHYKHYEWELRKAFEELERREQQLSESLSVNVELLDALKAWQEYETSYSSKGWDEIQNMVNTAIAKAESR